MVASELRVKEVMTRNPLSVHEDDLATKARSLFRRYGYRGLPVLSKKGEVAGIITDKDILNITSARSNILVRGLMSAPLVLANENEKIGILAKKLVSAGVDICLVGAKDGGKKLEGVVSSHDIIKAFLASGTKPKKRLVGEIMSRDVVVCTPSDEVSKIWNMVEQTGFSGVPVVKGKRVVGIVTRGDIIKSGYARLEREDEKGSSRKSSFVEKVMRTPAITVEPETEVEEAARVIVEKKIGRLPVGKKIGKSDVALVGIVDRSDILKAYI